MSDEQKNSNGGKPDRDATNPHALTLDIDEWTYAGIRILRVIGGIGRIVPPADRDKKSELGYLIESTDEQLARLWETWDDCIRPRLTKYELPGPPEWLLDAALGPRK